MSDLLPNTIMSALSIDGDVVRVSENKYRMKDGVLVRVTEEDATELPVEQIKAVLKWAQKTMSDVEIYDTGINPFEAERELGEVLDALFAQDAHIKILNTPQAEANITIETIYNDVTQISAMVHGIKRAMDLEHPERCLHVEQVADLIEGGWQPEFIPARIQEILDRRNAEKREATT